MTKCGAGAVASGIAAVAVSATLATSALLVSCTVARGRPVEAPVEIAVAPVAKVADGGLTTSAEREGPCALVLTAGRLEKSSRACYLDEHIDGASGLLRYACDGNGAAEAEFGDHRYVGRIEGGQVELELRGELDWEDGCRWGTRATIRGRVVRDDHASTFEALSWSYADYVITGSSCSGVCTAKTTIDVSELESSRDAEPAEDGDDDEDH